MGMVITNKFWLRLGCCGWGASAERVAGGELFLDRSKGQKELCATIRYS